MTSRSSLVGATILALVFVLIGPMTVADAQIGDSVTVTIDPASAKVVLGENLDLRVVVTNNGSETAPPLVVHLDITDPDQSTSVDPEDWTATLSKPIGAVPAGETATVEWTIQPISGGTFATYAVVLSAGADSVAASNVLQDHCGRPTYAQSRGHSPRRHRSADRRRSASRSSAPDRSTNHKAGRKFRTHV